jgi:hypothetical protein
MNGSSDRILEQSMRAKNLLGKGCRTDPQTKLAGVIDSLESISGLLKDLKYRL